jgi:signal transduction histidine kinase
MSGHSGKTVSETPFRHLIPLTAKMTFITFVVGLAAWALLDRFQTQRIEDLMYAQLQERLRQQAYHDRGEFDSYLRAHGKVVKLFASQKDFIEYLEALEDSDWLNDNIEEAVYHVRPPRWYPRVSIARAFVNVKYVLLIDPSIRTREIYARGPELPDAFLAPVGLLNLLTHNENYMTEVEGIPYLISAETLRNPDGGVRAILMLVCPIDSEFLIAAYGPPVSSRIVALLRGDPARLIASSNTDLLPEGTTAASHEGRYIAMGKSFFDYGISDLLVELVSFIPTAEAEALSREILSTERRQRAITALILIVSFAAIMFLITRKVDRLTNRIVEFAVNSLGQKPRDVSKGDQLMILDEQFQHLTKGILEYSEELEKRNIDLGKALEDARAADRAKSEFLANVSHELRTPMSGIIGMTELVLDTEQDEKLRNELGIVLSSAESLHVIVNDILDFSTIGAGRLELSRVPFGLRETLDNSINFFSIKAREKGLKLSFFMEDNVPEYLTGDPVRLRQILMCLVGNSVKFTERGAISLGVELDNQTGDEVRLHFYVSDTGIGISKEHIDVIFRPFAQADGSATRRYGGAGLGLALASSLVAMMGGTLMVKSKPGEGSTFHFALLFGFGIQK